MKKSFLTPFETTVIFFGGTRSAFVTMSAAEQLVGQTSSALAANFSQ